MTIEQRKILSDAHKGHKLSPERAKKLHDFNRGKKRSDEYKLKVSGVNHHLWKGGDLNLTPQKRWKQRNKDKVNYHTNLRRIRRLNVGGNHTLLEWENLKAQYNWTCPCCKKYEPEIKLSADHIIPISKGGSNNIENIQPLCRSCNSKKFIKIVKY